MYSGYSSPSHTYDVSGSRVLLCSAEYMADACMTDSQERSALPWKVKPSSASWSMRRGESLI